MTRFSLLTAGALALGVATTAAAEARPTFATLHIDTAPARVWQALQHRLTTDRDRLVRADHQRFEATLNLPGAGEVQVGADWDEVQGGTRLTWQPSTPASAAWMAQLAARAASEPRDNYLCGGDHSQPEDLPEAALSGPPSCGGGGGQLASALFELEKCGDYESALKILTACVRENHAGGLIRLAWFYENGLGVPRRLEQMTKYLRLAATSPTPGYRETAKVHYATALYFGIGSAVDRAGALRLFREAAAAGEGDAIHFLRHGYSTAWRGQDGGFYADPEWPLAQLK